MLITQLKSKETIVSLVEVGNVTGIITTDYICNPENMKLRLQKHKSAIDAADVVLVFSCGVGVQTIAEYLEDKKVCAACDTYPLPGFQGVTPLEYDCDQCGECYLNITGGICRIYRRLAQLGRLDELKCPVKIRNYATDDEVSKQTENC